MNRTLILALIGVAAGTGAAMMLTSRRQRAAIASDARHALDYATDYASEHMPAMGRSRRRKRAQPAAKRRPARRSRRAA